MLNVFFTAKALQLYDVACRQGFMSKVWSTVTGHSRCLFDLKTIQQTVSVQNRHFAGLQIVSMAQIRGSEGRSREFDVQFRPLQTHTKYRWINIAVAQQEGQPLPPVELIQIGDIYFVRDGHHRLSVAYMLGQEEIEAEVTIWETVGPLPWKQPTPGDMPKQHATPWANVCI